MRIQGCIVILASALIIVPGSAVAEEDAEGTQLFCRVARVTGNDVCSRVLEEAKKVSVCAELAAACPDSRPDGGFQRCTQIYGKIQSVRDTDSWRRDFNRSIDSTRAACYARSIVERNGGNWTQLLIWAGQPKGSKEWNAASR